MQIRFGRERLANGGAGGGGGSGDDDDSDDDDNDVDDDDDDDDDDDGEGDDYSCGHGDRRNPDRRACQFLPNQFVCRC